MSRRSPRRPSRPSARRERSRPSFQPRLLSEPQTIERLSHDGRGIARWQGKTLFVSGALPGETVRVFLTGEQRRFVEGEAREILQSAPERQNPPCRHYAQCGGCQLQHLAPEAQLAAKQTAVLDQLQRLGKVAPRTLAEPIRSPSEGYRHRARLGVWTERDGRVTLGFRRRGARELTPIETCEVLAPPLRALLAPLHHWLSGLRARGAVSHIELLLAHEGPAMVLRETGRLAPEDLAGLQDDGLSMLESRIWRQTDKATWLDVMGRSVDPRLSYRLPEFDLSLAFHPADFTQINAGVNRAMIRQAAAWLDLSPDERCLDLFCGLGNFTLPLARSGAQLLGREGSADMVTRARDNAARAGIPAQFETANLAEPAGSLWPGVKRIDAALLDPPRDGARSVIDPLARLRPARLVYVSCNPSTLARDAGELAAHGYDLQSLGVLDMFPHTEHVESMALFVRR